jgi:hypothetical protein
VGNRPIGMDQANAHAPRYLPACVRSSASAFTLHGMQAGGAYYSRRWPSEPVPAWSAPRATTVAATLDLTTADTPGASSAAEAESWAAAGGTLRSLTACRWGVAPRQRPSKACPTRWFCARDRSDRVLNVLASAGCTAGYRNTAASEPILARGVTA